MLAYRKKNTKEERLKVNVQKGPNIAREDKKNKEMWEQKTEEEKSSK